MQDNYIVWIKDFVIPLVAVFLGAVLAFWYSNKLQKQIEKRAKEAELKKDREFRTWQLNYLNVFLYRQIIVLFYTEGTLQKRAVLLADILSNGNFNIAKHEDLMRPMSAFRTPLKLNIDELIFAADDNDFIVTLAEVQNFLFRYYDAVEIVNKNSEILERQVRVQPLTNDNIKSLIKINQFCLNETLSAIAILNAMLAKVKEYNVKHDNLLLNKVREFNSKEQMTINSANKFYTEVEINDSKK